MNEATNNWITPKIWIDRAEEAMGSIDLDPCAHPDGYTNGKAICYAGPEHDSTDGLKAPWFGNMWINPPYLMPDIHLFSNRIVHACEEDFIKINGVRQMIVLVNSKTDTLWYHAIARKALATCLIRGRIPHEKPGRIPTNTCRNNHTIFYLARDTQRLRKFYNVFRDHGIIYGPVCN